MKNPSPNQQLQNVRDAFTTLRQLDAKKLKQLQADLETYLTRAQRAPRARVDGYPSSTMGGGGGGASITVLDEHGREVSVPVTSVEAAAFAPPPKDPIADHVERALAHLYEASGNIAALTGQLALLDRLANRDPLDIIQCTACARAGITGTPVYQAATTVNKRLDRFEDLCEPHYDYVRARDELPTDEQTRHRHHTGQWRIRVA
jgi:hypothetical protein